MVPTPVNYRGSTGRFQHRERRLSRGLRQCAFLLGFLQGFVNSAHSFPSLGASRSELL